MILSTSAMSTPSTPEDKTRVLKTIGQMLIDRGYSIDIEDILTKAETFIKGDSSSFSHIVQNKYATLLQPSNIAIIWEPQFVVKTLRNYEEYMYDNKVNNAILITDTILNIYVKRALKELSNRNNPKHKKITVFFSYELVVNITQHPWVPLHQGLTPEEEETTMSKYRLKKKQFPRISINDPVAKYYGYIRGQIVKITRKEYCPKTNRLISIEITYRIVV